MTNILVTGAQGYVGRYVVSALLAEGKNVIGIGRSEENPDHFTHHYDFHGASNQAPLPKDFQKAAVSGATYNYERCDLSDNTSVEKLIKSVAPTTIIHLAGALRDENWQSLANSNLTATLNLMQASSNLRNKPIFVLGSTGSVYGDQDVPILETASPKPIGSYAISKYMAELMAQDIAQSAGMPLIISRIFNIIGPGLQPRHLAGYLVHRIAEIETLKSDAVITVGDLTTIRDFIDVRDIALFLASDLSKFKGITPLNMASGIEVEMNTIVDKLLSLSDKSITLNSDSTRNRSGADRVFANIDTLKSAYKLRYSMDQSLEDMLDYARFVLS